MKAKFYSLKAFVFSLFICSCIGQAANAQDLIVGRENWTAASDGSTALEGDIIICSLTVVTYSNAITNATLANVIPTGTIYEPGNTFLNGVAIADVNGTMPFMNGGLINGGTLAANTTYDIFYQVKVTANGGTIQYTQHLLGDNGVDIAPSNTAPTILSAVGICNVIFSVTPPNSGDNFPFNQVKRIYPLNGLVIGNDYNGLTGRCYDIINGSPQLLPDGSLLTDVSGAAYEVSTNRLYFVNSSTTVAQELCYVSLGGASKAAYRISGTNMGTNVTRMTMGINRTGYALNDNGTELRRFVVNDNTATITPLGALINDAANGSINVLTEAGGDICSDGAGKLYLVVNSGRVFKIDPDTRIATYLGTVTFSPSNTIGITGVAISTDGAIYLAGRNHNVYKVNLAAMTATAVNSSTFNIFASGDFASCGLPMQAVRVATNEKPAVNNAEVTSEEVFAKVQPNPFHKELNLQVQLKTAELVKMRLIDLYGRTVYSSTEKLGAGVNSLRIPVPDGLATGMYVVELWAGDKQLLQKKLLKQ